VNCVCPGIVDTPMWLELDRRLAELGAAVRFDSRAAEAPLGRPASPEEVAHVICFRLSEAAAFMTGEDVNVTGGLVMHLMSGRQAAGVRRVGEAPERFRVSSALLGNPWLPTVMFAPLTAVARTRGRRCST
jgi:hypothetical protein